MDDVVLPFQPGTISRDVLRRPIFLLGGMRAILLQVAEPRIAAGVAEHSDFTGRVFDRLRHTVELLMQVGLREPAAAQRAIAEMEQAHRGVHGSLPDGTTYDAEDPELRLWVLATLIDTVLAVEEAYVGEFRDEHRRRYYRESLEVARILDTGEAPADLEEFHAYMSESFARLEVTAQARKVADHVLHPMLGWAPPPLFAPLRVITTDLLPGRLRDAYGLRLSPGQARRLRRLQSISRATVPRMPQWIRTFPVLRPVRGLRDRKALR